MFLLLALLFNIQAGVSLRRLEFWPAASICTWRFIYIVLVLVWSL